MRAMTFLGLALVIGCGSKPDPAVVAQPADDEAKASIAAYLGERGLSQVEFVSIAPSEMPSDIKAKDAWAFAFSAKFRNVLGEDQSSENWIAVLTKYEGRVNVTACLDTARKPVGERVVEETAPAIVAPKP